MTKLLTFWYIQSSSLLEWRASMLLALLGIRNDLFRICIQCWIFWDPVPGKSSGSNPFYLSIFGNLKNTPLIQTKRRIYQLSAILYFMLQSYSTHSPEFKGLKWEIKFLFTVSALSFFAGSGSRQKLSMRIRNTGFLDDQTSSLQLQGWLNCSFGGWLSLLLAGVGRLEWSNKWLVWMIN